jgi:hypothetical protein
MSKVKCRCRTSRLGVWVESRNISSFITDVGFFSNYFLSRVSRLGKSTLDPISSGLYIGSRPSTKFPQNPSGLVAGLPYHYPGSWFIPNVSVFLDTYVYKQSTHVSSFFQAGTRFFSLHNLNNFCVDRSELLVHFFYPTCRFNPKFPFLLYYSFQLPLFLKLLLYRCPFHTPSEYMLHGNRSLIWLFHFNRSGFSDLDLLWVLIEVKVYVQRSFWAYHG